MAGTGSTSRRGMWIALVVGIAIGLGLGLFYTWELDPVIELNTAPWQLNAAAREDYVIAVAMSYAYNNDLARAFDRLRAVAPDRDVWQMVADIACERHKSIQIASNSDILVMRALERLYRSQGASGCADGLYPTPAPVVFLSPTPVQTAPVLPPPPTKTPVPDLPAPTASPAPLPTDPPTTDRYIIARVESYCDASRDGLLEVRVFDARGQGVRGVPVLVTSGTGIRDQFFTGLKPGREPGYADFQMEQGRAYQVSIPGLVSDPRSLAAEPCQAQSGGETVTVTTSYRINFQQQAN